MGTYRSVGTPSVAGEVNTNSNSGGGVGLVGTKVGEDTPIKSITSIDNSVQVAENGLEVDLSVDAPGEINTNTNVGVGSGLVLPKIGVNTRVRTISSPDDSIDIVVSGNNMFIETNTSTDTDAIHINGVNELSQIPTMSTAMNTDLFIKELVNGEKRVMRMDDIAIEVKARDVNQVDNASSNNYNILTSGEVDSRIVSGGGESNTNSNVGAGEGFVLPKVGVNTPMKTLKLIGGGSIASDADSITIDLSGLGGGGGSSPSDAYYYGQLYNNIDVTPAQMQGNNFFVGYGTEAVNLLNASPAYQNGLVSATNNDGIDRINANLVMRLTNIASTSSTYNIEVVIGTHQGPVQVATLTGQVNGGIAPDRDINLNANFVYFPPASGPPPDHVDTVIMVWLRSNIVGASCRIATGSTISVIGVA